MKNWQTKKLWEVCDKTSNIKWSEVKDRDFKYIDLSAVSRNNLEVNSFVLVDSTSAPSRAKKIVQSGDIIFATTRPTLKRIAKITDEFNDQICSTGFVVLRAQKDCIISDIIFYFLQTDSFMESMKNLQRGASYPAVSDGDVKDQVLGIPKSLDEQKRIVEILDGVFGDILIARENVQKNLANAKELFESYLESIFTNEKLRKKNEKWEEKKLGEVCDFQGGSQPPKQTFIHEPKKDYIRFLQIRDFKGYKTETYIPVDKKNKICKRDDVLIGRYGASVGNILRGMSGAYNVALMRARSHDIFNKNYFYYYLISDLFQKNLLSKSSRSAQDGFNKSDIYNFEIPLPSLSEQKQIVKKLDALSVETKKLEKIYQQKIDDLDELKKAVLKKAFAGEL